jgi:hypothetical protein
MCLLPSLESEDKVIIKCFSDFQCMILTSDMHKILSIVMKEEYRFIFKDYWQLNSIKYGPFFSACTCINVNSLLCMVVTRLKFLCVLSHMSQFEKYRYPAPRNFMLGPCAIAVVYVLHIIAIGDLWMEHGTGWDLEHCLFLRYAIECISYKV